MPGGGAAAASVVLGMGGEMSESRANDTKTVRDGRVARGNQTRQMILRHSVNIASMEGLQGLSLGRLAEELKLSKSGVFALFGSIEQLQLATVRTAIAVFIDRVAAPVRKLPPGVDKIHQLCETWLDYSKNRVFPGGCFFYSVTAEFDARTGPVHDIIAAAQDNWQTFVEQVIEDAREAGKIRADTDVAQLAFELIALMDGANGTSVMYNKTTVYDRASRAILRRLREVATDPALLPDPA